MKLRELHLTEVIVVPGYSPVTGGERVVREQSFTADDGWELYASSSSPPEFSIGRADMAEPVVVGGVGYTYVAAADEEQEDGEPMMGSTTGGGA